MSGYLGMTPSWLWWDREEGRRTACDAEKEGRVGMAWVTLQNESLSVAV